MQTVEPAHQNATHESATSDHSATAASARPTANPASTVGPLGGIVFSALCFASYAAVIVGVAM
jgi:hypothetical protein